MLSVWLECWHGRGFNSQVKVRNNWVHFGSILPGFRDLFLLEYILFNCPGHHFLSRVLIMGGLYILGAVLYGCRLTWLCQNLVDDNSWSFCLKFPHHRTLFRIPERFLPGKFDIWFQSHQVTLDTSLPRLQVLESKVWKTFDRRRDMKMIIAWRGFCFRSSMCLWLLPLLFTITGWRTWQFMGDTDWTKLSTYKNNTAQFAHNGN